MPAVLGRLVATAKGALTKMGYGLRPNGTQAFAVIYTDASGNAIDWQRLDALDISVSVSNSSQAGQTPPRRSL